MEVPKLGVEWELWPPAYPTATATGDPSCVFYLHYSSQQCWIFNPLREARDRTFSSWILVRFVSGVRTGALVFHYSCRFLATLFFKMLSTFSVQYPGFSALHLPLHGDMALLPLRAIPLLCSRFSFLSWDLYSTRYLFFFFFFLFLVLPHQFINFSFSTKSFPSLYKCVLVSPPPPPTPMACRRCQARGQTLATATTQASL